MRKKLIAAACLTAALTFAGSVGGLYKIRKDNQRKYRAISTMQGKVTFNENIEQFAVIANAQGNVAYCKDIANQLEELGVRNVFFTGNIAKNDSIVPHPSEATNTDDSTEIVDCVEPFVEKQDFFNFIKYVFTKEKKRVFLIPGDHETKHSYTDVTRFLQFNYNVYAVNAGKISFQNADVVTAGGTHLIRKEHKAKDVTTGEDFYLGFHLPNDYYKGLEKLINKYKPTIFITHDAPLSEHEIDRKRVYKYRDIEGEDLKKYSGMKKYSEFAYGGRKTLVKGKTGYSINIGNKELRRIMLQNENIFHISGMDTDPKESQLIVDKEGNPILDENGNKMTTFPELIRYPNGNISYNARQLDSIEPRAYIFTVEDGTIKRSPKTLQPKHHDFIEAKLE